MSYFRSKAIVLKKTKYGEKEFLYSLFSYDYWKIDVLKKKAAKEKPLDIGYDINFEVYSQNNNTLSRIANIQIIDEFDPTKHDFETINEYLSLIFMVYTKTAKNLPIYEIYILLNELHKTTISKEKIIIAKLKLKEILWELPLENSDNTIKKILHYIHNNSARNCLRLKDVSDIHTIELLKIIWD